MVLSPQKAREAIRNAAQRGLTTRVRALDLQTRHTDRMERRLRRRVRDVTRAEAEICADYQRVLAVHHPTLAYDAEMVWALAVCNELLPDRSVAEQGTRVLDDTHTLWVERVGATVLQWRSEGDRSLGFDISTCQTVKHAKALVRELLEAEIDAPEISSVSVEVTDTRSDVSL